MIRRTPAARLGMAALLLGLAAAPACLFMLPSRGGGQTEWTGPRRIEPGDVALLDGYAIEVVARGLTFPTSLAFDDEGRPHVLEAGYSYGEVFTEPRLLRIEPDGALTPVATGGGNGPWTHVDHHRGAFYVSEGGQIEGGRILRIAPDGRIDALVEGLPGQGDHHTNAATVGPDGYIYFGQGTATNSAVVGPDNFRFGWLARHPEFHDIPCGDVVLRGRNFRSEDPLDGNGGEAETGAYSPFGTATEPGQVVPGALPCTGAVMRLPLEGGPLELVAWGFRNPFGLAFAPDGRLYATENGYDVRGSRPVWGTADVLWRVQSGSWYGWPDFAAGRPFPNRDVEPLLAEHPGELPRPIAVFGVHSSSNGLDFCRNPDFGFEGQAFVAQLGDQAPIVGKVVNPVGFKVVRVDVALGVVHDFAVNAGPRNGPASRLGSGGLERPVDVAFAPDGLSLYVVDFGVLQMSGEGARPRRETGVVWKITRLGGRP